MAPGAFIPVISTRFPVTCACFPVACVCFPQIKGDRLLFRTSAWHDKGFGPARCAGLGAVDHDADLFYSVTRVFYWVTQLFYWVTQLFCWVTQQNNSVGRNGDCGSESAIWGDGADRRRALGSVSEGSWARLGRKS